MSSADVVREYRKAIAATWYIGFVFSRRSEDKAIRAVQLADIYKHLEVIRAVGQNITDKLPDSTQKSNFSDNFYTILSKDSGKKTTQLSQFISDLDSESAWKIAAARYAPDDTIFVENYLPAWTNGFVGYVLNKTADQLVGYRDNREIKSSQELVYLRIIESTLGPINVTGLPSVKVPARLAQLDEKNKTSTKAETIDLTKFRPEYVKYSKVLLNHFAKAPGNSDAVTAFTKLYLGVKLPQKTYTNEVENELKRDVLIDLKFSLKASYYDIYYVLHRITEQILVAYKATRRDTSNKTVKIALDEVVGTVYDTDYVESIAAEEGVTPVKPEDTTVFPQTPPTINETLQSLNAEVSKAELEGSKKALKTIEKLLQTYPAGTPDSANTKVNKQLRELKNHFTNIVKIRTQELAANPAKVTPDAEKRKPGEKKGTGEEAKKATEAAYKQGGVEAKITKDRGYNSTPISQAVKVEFYEEDEPIEVQPATARIILKDPLTDTPNLDYPTNLIDTDLNDFRRAQLVLPYSVGEGSAKLSWFKLSTNPAVSGITEQSTGGPTLENIFGNNASYNQFFLKGLEESRNEKFQLVDTPAQGQTLFSFGEKPEFWTIRGQLLNDSINDWTNKFRVAWINHMRLNQLTRTGRYMEVHIPAIRLMFTCYPVALSLSHADESETVTNFAMMVFKRSEKVLPNLSYTKQDAKAAMLNTLLSLDYKSVLLEVPTKGNLAPIDPTTGKPYTNISAEPTTSKEVTTRIDRATQGGESGADGSGKSVSTETATRATSTFPKKKLDNRRS